MATTFRPFFHLIWDSTSRAYYNWRRQTDSQTICTRKVLERAVDVNLARITLWLTPTQPSAPPSTPRPATLPNMGFPHTDAQIWWPCLRKSTLPTSQQILKGSIQRFLLNPSFPGSLRRSLVGSGEDRRDGFSGQRWEGWQHHGSTLHQDKGKWKEDSKEKESNGKQSQRWWCSSTQSIEYSKA